MRWSRCLLAAAATLASGAVPTVHAQAAAASSANYVRIVPREVDRRVDILIGGKPFTSYIYPTTLKKPVLYPLRTASGVVVTRGYPLEPRPGERTDHPHHAGLWLNYGNVNGLDFWNNSDAITPNDAPKMGTILHRAVKGVKSGDGEGTLDVTSDWVNHDGKALLREATRFVFRAQRGARSIERIATLTALDTAVSFKDDKEGLLGLRVARSLEHPSTKPETFVDAAGRPTVVQAGDTAGVTGRYRSSEGKEGDDVWGTRGRWTMLTGTVEQHPVTIAILDHPKNPGFPTYWHARGYGLFAANNLGQKILSDGKEELHFTLDARTSVTFRHEVLLLDGAATPADIERFYSAFADRSLSSQTQRVATRGINQLTPQERRDGWRLLWDGTTFNGWRGLGYDTVPTKHWVIEDGAIKKIASGQIARRPDGLPIAGGDLMSVDTFRNFELSWEWKVAPGSNSGLKYNVSEELSVGPKADNHSALGFEYQMIDDDRHPDGKLFKHKTADLYDLVPSNDKKHVKPVGEWNQSRVVFRGNHGEHWLNGEKVVEYDLGAPEMNKALAESKWKQLPWFGERRTGHIVLQDHGDEVYFRNIKIREMGGSK